VYCFGSRRSDCATATLIESAARAQCMELLLGATVLELNSGGASARRIGVSMFRWPKTEYAARHAIGVIGQMNHQVAVVAYAAASCLPDCSIEAISAAGTGLLK
jgi:hypothetical protein